MNFGPALIGFCRQVEMWYAEGTLLARVLPWMFLTNMLVLCVILGIKSLVLTALRYWEDRRSSQKGLNYIYNLEECPICFQDFCEPVRLACGHVNCLECLTNYCRYMNPLGSTFRCSLCREPIKDVSLLDGYTNSILEKDQRTSILDELRKLVCAQPQNVRWVRR